MKKVLLPVRVDFIGGWTDQVYWPFEGAVVNAAIGWKGCFENKYPLQILNGKVESKIEGVGTGLGISSIIHAGLFLERNPDDDYIDYVLKKEEEMGVKGGWQDQIGAVEPGLKLTTTLDHKQFKIVQKDDHPIIDHLIVFDTGIRRPSKALGDKIRGLFGTKSFDKTMRKIAEMAKRSVDMDTEEFAKTCLEAWSMLNTFVNADLAIIPKTNLLWGYKLVGAGGGGFGIAFVKDPKAKKEVIKIFEQSDMWAINPILLDGVKIK